MAGGWKFCPIYHKYEACSKVTLGTTCTYTNGRVGEVCSETVGLNVWPKSKKKKRSKRHHHPRKASKAVIDSSALMTHDILEKLRVSFTILSEQDKRNKGNVKITMWSQPPPRTFTGLLKYSIDHQTLYYYLRSRTLILVPCRKIDAVLRCFLRSHLLRTNSHHLYVCVRCHNDAITAYVCDTTTSLHYYCCTGHGSAGR